jgi:putative ABC transport system permease protein
VLKVALRGVVAHRHRLLLTFLAVVVSVAFMMATQVLTGTIQARFETIFSDIYRDVDVVVRSRAKVEADVGALRAPVSGDLVPTVGVVAGVKAAQGQVQSVVTLLDKDGEPMGSGQFGSPTFGLNWLTNPDLNGWRLSTGRPPQAGDEVVIDERSADRAGYRPGDRIGIETRKGKGDFTVVGLAGFGETPDYAGSPAALFDTPTAQELLVQPGYFTWIRVAGEPDVSQEVLRTRIARELPATAEAVTAEAFTEESQDVFRRIFDILGRVLLAFGLVAVFVGGFIIYNTFSILVTQRTRELALLRAMGASRGQVLRSITVESAAVGAAASLVGLVAGLALAAALTALLSRSVPAAAGQGLRPSPLAFASSFAVGLAITVLSAFLPARRAAAIPPVAALREVEVDPTGHSPRRLALGVAITVVGAAVLWWGLFASAQDVAARTGAGIFGVMLGTIVLGPLFAGSLSGALGAPLRAFPGRLARANARRNPRRTAATASALMIGVALIVMFAIVVESLKSSVDRGLASAFKADLIVDSRTFGVGGFPPDLLDQVGAVPGVEDVLGVQAGVVTVGKQPAQVLAADARRLDQFLNVTVDSGNLDLADDEVAVPRALAADNNLQVGSDVPMTVLQGGERLFKVGAVYEVPNVGSLGYLMGPAGFAASFPPSFQQYNQIHVRTAPDADPAAVRRALRTVVTARQPSAQVVDVGEYAASQTQRLDVLLVIIDVLLLLAVLIAGLGIVNTLLLSIAERTREIGLLRAVGMARTQVRTTVRWESVIFSLQGTVLGMVTGGLLAWALVAALSRESALFTLALPWAQLAAVPLVAVVAGVLAALLPAATAARLDVLAAIATE